MKYSFNKEVLLIEFPDYKISFERLSCNNVKIRIFKKENIFFPLKIEGSKESYWEKEYGLFLFLKLTSKYGSTIEIKLYEGDDWDLIFRAIGVMEGIFTLTREGYFEFRN